MKQKIVVLGGGLAGLAAAFTIQKNLRRRRAVTLVAASPRMELRQALPRVAFGLKHEEKTLIDLPQVLSKKGIAFKQARAVKIDAANCRVETDHGAINYDYLALALGAKWNWWRVQGSENAFSLGSLEQALKARDAISSFRGGGACSIAGEGNRWEGPALETIFHFHAFLPAAGLREKSSLYYITAKKRPFEELGPAVSGLVEKELQKRGIKLHSQSKVKKITKNSIVLWDGSEIASGLSFLYPGCSGNDAAIGSGVTDFQNFVLVDEFMRAKGAGAKNVFAAGDCVNSLSLKMGFNALSGATVAGENIAREILGKPLQKFSPKIVYVMELGSGAGLLINARLNQGKWVARTSVGGLPFLRKLAFEKSFLEQTGIVNYALGEKLG